MRIPLIKTFIPLPLDGLLEHAEKVKECAWAFQQAMECYTSDQCQSFEEYRQEVNRLESDADAIKRRIRGHIPARTRLPVSKFQIFWYLREQDRVLDSVEEVLDWLSYRINAGFPEVLKRDLLILVDSVVEPIEDLSRMVEEAIKYFDSYSNRQRNIVKEIINNLREREHDVDRIEDDLKLKIFSTEKDPIGIYHMVGLTEKIGSIADHAENAGDMMRAMIARKGKYFGGKE